MADFNYQSVKAFYSGRRPKGFTEFMIAHGKGGSIYTCGVRLTYAIFKADPSFFKDKKAASGVEWFGLPTRASDVSKLLTQYVKQPIKITSKSEITGKEGIVYYDTITGFSGSGHIAVWEFTKFHLGKEDDYFHSSPSIYFYDFTVPPPTGG